MASESQSLTHDKQHKPTAPSEMHRNKREGGGGGVIRIGEG